MNFRIIAFDAATIKTGYAVADCTPTETKLVAVGVIQGSGGMGKRLGQLHTRVTDLLEQYKPNYFTVEDLKINPYTPNLPSKIKVGYAIGVVMSAAGLKKLPDPICINARSMRSRWAVKSNDKGKLRRAVNLKFEKDLIELGFSYGFEKKHEDISDAVGHLVAVAGIIRTGDENADAVENKEAKPKKKKKNVRKVRNAGMPKL